jgi:hypothetical protein
MYIGQKTLEERTKIEKTGSHIALVDSLYCLRVHGDAPAAQNDAQNAFGRPASFNTLFAVCRDAMVTGTVNGLSAWGLIQIS